VLREEFIEYVIYGLRDELRKRHEDLNAELSELREEKRSIEAKLKNLVDTIETKTASPTVMARIAEHEARIQAITNKLLEPGPESLEEKLEELRTLAVERLTQLRGLLTNPSAIHEARALLASKLESSLWKGFTVMGRSLSKRMERLISSGKRRLHN
jgi:chromosome segregation ATPase